MADRLTTRVLAWMRYPVLGSLLNSRLAGLGIALLLGLHLLSRWVGVALYSCPILKVTGVPCPGCGLSRGAAATARLDFSEVLWWNAFGPAALFVVVLALASGVLPDGPRRKLVVWVARVEKKTGVTNVLLTLLALYWACRLLILGGELGIRLSAFP